MRPTLPGPWSTLAILTTEAPTVYTNGEESQEDKCPVQKESALSRHIIDFSAPQTRHFAIGHIPIEVYMRRISKKSRNCHTKVHASILEVGDGPYPPLSI